MFVEQIASPVLLEVIFFVLFIFLIILFMFIISLFRYRG